jgi:hypothetical protein
MQRRLRPLNVQFGLALGIATAGVLLALGGCAITTGTSHSTQSAGSAPMAASASAPASLDDFSADEQARILAVQVIVAEAAAEHQLDPALLNAMIWVESRFNPKAKSPAGARGLMQLMPATAAYLAKRMGEHSARAYDPEFNVRAGALYLAEMKHKFGDEQLAVAAYHAGPGNVKKWVEAGQTFPEYSDAYVAKVMDARARFSGIEVHGRRSGARTPAVAPVSSSKREPTTTPEVVTIETDPVDDLVAPDVDSLPDAAEIHGVERVIYEGAEPEPEVSEEPVFEVHPELDRNPSAPPPGWRTAPREQPKPTAKPKPAAKPKPTAKPKPAPKTEDEVGIGVLPDL